MFGEIFEAEGQLCFLAVLVFVFTCSALVLTVLCGLEFKAKPQSYHDQDKLPSSLLPTPSFKARWKCRCVIALNSQDVTL